MRKQIGQVGAWTLASRVVGFGRDILMAAILGAGPVADAFLIAFRLPNHFRAIFAEGAFNTAYVPSYSRVRATEGETAAARFASRIFSLQLLVQLVFFLHMGTSPEQRENLSPFIFTVLIIAIIVGGSAWVLHNMNANMMPM